MTISATQQKDLRAIVEDREQLLTLAEKLLDVRSLEEDIAVRMELRRAIRIARAREEAVA